MTNMKYCPECGESAEYSMTTSFKVGDTCERCLTVIDKEVNAIYSIGKKSHKELRYKRLAKLDAILNKSDLRHLMSYQIGNRFTSIEYKISNLSHISLEIDNYSYDCKIYENESLRETRRFLNIRELDNFLEEVPINEYNEIKTNYSFIHDAINRSPLNTSRW